MRKIDQLRIKTVELKLNFILWKNSYFKKKGGLFITTMLICFFIYCFTFAIDSTLIEFYTEQTFSPWGTKLLSDVMSGVSRSIGQFLLIALTCLAIALPVTANIYTPRLVKLFMTDKFNIIMLILILFTLVQNIIAFYGVRYSNSIQFQYYFTLSLFFFELCLLISYFLHMANYFNPSFLLHRFEKTVIQLLVKISKEHKHSSQTKILILFNLDNIGNMVLKSIYSSDREIALTGIKVFQNILDEYQKIKHEMPDGWLQLDYSRFKGMSTEGLTEVNEREIWFELLILRYLSRAFSKSLNFMEDLVSEIAAQNQKIGVTSLLKGDDEVVYLIIRSFNTYLNQAISNQDKLSSHNVLYQYVSFAQVISVFQPKLVREIARYIFFHVKRGKHYIGEIAIIELTNLAFTIKEPETYEYICKHILLITIPKEQEMKHKIIKTKLIFAAMLQEKNDQKNLTLILEQFQTIPKSKLNSFYKELVIKNEMIYYEITDRFISPTHIKQSRKFALEQIFQQLNYSPHLETTV